MTTSKKPYGIEWRESYKSLAQLYDMTVIGVRNVGRIEWGPWRGHKCIGCSIAVGPDGALLAQTPYGEAAEALIEVPVEVKPFPARGTLVALVLLERGYSGI